MPAPHPDDFDAIGMTLSFFHRHGADIFLDVISGSANGVEDGFCENDLPETKQRVREQEQRESLLYFGLPLERVTFLRFPEDEAGDPRNGPEEIERLEQRWRQTMPQLVFLPHGNDSNIGHQRTWRMLEQLISSKDCPSLIFLARDPKTRQSCMDAFMPFGEVEAQWKAQLLRCHKSQQSRNLHLRGYGFDKRILQLNRALAQELGGTAPYVEAFELAEPLSCR